MLVVFVGCGKEATRHAAPPPVPALLGKRTDATVDHFVKTCTGRFADLQSALQCDLPTGDYQITFDLHDRTHIIAFHGVPEAELRERFDVAIVPLLPPDTRELMRSSVGDGFKRGPSKDRSFYRAATFDANGAEILQDVMPGLKGGIDMAWYLAGIDL